MDEAADTLRLRERQEADRALARIRRELGEVVGRARAQSEVFQMLPAVLGQMFAAQGRRAVGPLALKIVDELLRPEQCAVFVARPGHRCVALAAGLRLPPHVQPGLEIEYGRGRIGHVAQHTVGMDESDFRALPLATRREVDGNVIEGLRPDVVVPIEQDGEVVGLLCAGGVRARHGQEKRLLMMVADLTGVAMAHVARLRAVDGSSHLDGLTGVWNARRFQERLEAEVRKAGSEGTTLSLLILDVDHFRAYNKANGHQEGDDILRKLGHLLKTSVREDDVVARHGGADFVVLYPGAGKALASRLANTLRHAVESFPFPHRTGQPQGRLTVSGGVATFPEDAGTAGDLVRSADQARCDAKAAGGNRVVAAAAFDTA